jgi:hypothetical protein
MNKLLVSENSRHSNNMHTRAVYCWHDFNLIKYNIFTSIKYPIYYIYTTLYVDEKVATNYSQILTTIVGTHGFSFHILRSLNEVPVYEMSEFRRWILVRIDIITPNAHIKKSNSKVLNSFKNQGTTFPVTAGEVCVLFWTLVSLHPTFQLNDRRTERETLAVYHNMPIGLP